MREKPPNEVHPLNPSIVRGRFGIWGEDILPVTHWEVPAERRLIPNDIVVIMDALCPVARVDADTARKQLRKHHQTIDLWERFDNVILGWEWWRKQTPEEARTNAYERWQFVQSIFDETSSKGWPLLTVLEKQPDSSIKIITSHRRRYSFWTPVRNGNLYRSRGEE